MSRRRRRRDDEYEVGYGRPPREHQFKKGGRKAHGPIETIDLAEVLSRPVRARVNGKVRDVHPYEAMLRQMLTKALKEKHVNSLIEIIELFEKHGVYAPPARHSGGGIAIVARARLRAGERNDTSAKGGGNE